MEISSASGEGANDTRSGGRPAMSMRSVTLPVSLVARADGYSVDGSRQLTRFGWPADQTVAA
jgi:hypothetical protein